MATPKPLQDVPVTARTMERQFVEAAARTAFVMAWAEHTKNTCDFQAANRGPGSHRCNRPRESHGIAHTFTLRSFVGQRLEDVAPPTPDYAREWAWKLLGALEEINPQWGCNLASILAAAARADGMVISTDEIPSVIRHFGSDIAMMALGTGVSWFDDHATFKLKVPEWDVRGFELEGVSDGR